MANSDYIESKLSAPFAPVALLGEAVDYLDRVLLLTSATFPRTDSLYVGMAVLVDDEFMQVTEVGDMSVTVNRGCADTVPAKHSAGAVAWFIDTNDINSDKKEYIAGETNAVKYSPYTSSGKLDIATSGSIDVVKYNYRFTRPYPPGALRVRGDRWWVEHTLSADSGPLTLTWAQRDRIIEADQLVDHDAADIGPEPGTSYTARVYDEQGTLKATYTDIMKDVTDRYGRKLPVQWSYTWDHAMADLNGVASEIGTLIPGSITFYSTRDGYDSWQGYTIPFKVDTQGLFIKAAQLAMLAAQPDNIGTTDYPPQSALFAGQLAHLAAQNLTDADMSDSGPTTGVFVASLHEGVGQETNFYTMLNRNLFEAPHAMLVKRGEDASQARLVTVAARPSDRLTDSHAIWTRYNWPHGHGALVPYEHRVDPEFTPWLTLGSTLDYLTTTFSIGKTSFPDGVSLSNVQVGQVALIDAEFVRIDARDATTFTVARGCYDTVPGKHRVGTRMWFVEAAAGNDPTNYPYTLDTLNQLGSAAEVKMVPAVYGPPLDLKNVPTDTLDMAHRVERPYAPGEVLVNGAPWFNGCVVQANQDVVISWAHRNRDTQRGDAVDHHAPTRVPEDGQKYHLFIKLSLYDSASHSYYSTTVRDLIVDGSSFTYTYSMAQTDGYRAGRLLGVCGFVTVGLVLEAVRNDLSSWQNYVIPLALPSYACPPGQAPGGGQLPPSTGGGNGDTGPTPGDGGSDNTGGSDPGDNGSGGNGNGAPPPPDVPPTWPGPVDPPPQPDPDDPNPELAGHWDTNWDRHWDAYTKDNQGS